MAGSDKVVWEKRVGDYEAVEQIVKNMEINVPFFPQCRKYAHKSFFTSKFGFVITCKGSRYIGSKELRSYQLN